MSIRSQRDSIRQQFIGNQPKQVLLVEGQDDRDAFRILMERFLTGWEQRWAIVEAGNKAQLLALLALEPDWLGLVDRDEWDQAAIDDHVAQRPNLMVLPRFCLENHLINPSELWQAIPPVHQAKVVGGESEFRDAIEAELARYRRHGVLWKVVAPLWSGLRALGFKEALASKASVSTAQDDAQIQRVLTAWDGLLDPRKIFAEFQAQLGAAAGATITVQYSHWVHGKLYWKKVVNAVMNRRFGQMPEAKRRIDILRRLPRPADLEPILQRLSQPKLSHPNSHAQGGRP